MADDELWSQVAEVLGGAQVQSTRNGDADSFDRKRKVASFVMV